jgi:predicted PurR-regulated permease PerM
LRCVYVQPGANISNKAATEKPNVSVSFLVISILFFFFTDLLYVKITTTTTTTTNTNHVQSVSKKAEESQASNEEVTEKMRKMEEELNKYKKEVEGLREAETVVIDKVQVKTAGHSSSILILLALLVAAVAYFVYSK